ncbi:DUF2528 family protein [Escherichia coli]|nr:DUF2528 family protein [Escherichia coli]
MIWQPEFTDKTLSRKPGAVQNGQEGWPPMDGSEGIRITDIDTSGIFDSDDMTIKAA